MSEQDEDPRVRRFLEDFVALFPSFRRRYTVEQQARYWIPAVKTCSMDELNEVLDHFAYHWPDYTKMPSPGEFLKVVRAKRRPEWFDDDDPKVARIPLSDDTLTRIEATRRSVGLRPWTSEQREAFRTAGCEEPDQEDAS